MMIIPLADAMIVPIGLPALSFSPVDIVPTCMVRNSKKKNQDSVINIVLSLKDTTSSLFPLPLPFITAASIISAESILDGLNLGVGL